MKRCPTCNKTFTDQNVSFCIEDGTPLVTTAVQADETTVVSPSPGEGSNPPAPQAYTPRDWQPPDYQPPGFQIPANAASKRKVWPWVIGIVAVGVIGLIALGIVAAILVRNMRSASYRSSANYNANVQRSERDSPRNANTPGSTPEVDNVEGDTNGNSADEVTTPPPTDDAEVLAQLTELEHEWTVANINADKNKLDRILADDYVGASSEGKSQGKAEYIRTIERDTSIEKWDFEDLDVALKGDRASLRGTIRLQLREQTLAFRFTDKFVWRDARWQAVSSEVTPIKQNSGQ